MIFLHNDELIPKRLKKLREEKGWSQTQAGDAIGAGRGAWQQWELRKRTPSDTALIAASYIFNVSLPYICGVDDEPTPQSMIIPESRLQPMDRNGIEAYLSLTRQEKEFVRKTMDFLLIGINSRVPAAGTVICSGSVLFRYHFSSLNHRIQLFQTTFLHNPQLFQGTFQFSYFFSPHSQASKSSFGTRYMVPILCTRKGPPSV